MVGSDEGCIRCLAAMALCFPIFEVSRFPWPWLLLKLFQVWILDFASLRLTVLIGSFLVDDALFAVL